MAVYLGSNKVAGIGGTSGSSESTPNIYSTEEQAIGTWIDGKPVYRRVVEFNTPTTNKEETAIGTISDLKTIVRMTGMSLVGSEFLHLPVNTTTDTYFIATGVKSDGTIYCQQNGLPNMKSYLIIEYTKTTD